MPANRKDELRAASVSSFLFTSRWKRTSSLTALLWMLLSCATFPQNKPLPASGMTTGNVSLEALQNGFRTPPSDNRIMMRWWWFGPAVTRTELEREMQAMKEGGIGGFEVQPVYPLVLDDPALGIRTLHYLSDEFIDALRFTAAKARELGLRMDLTLGSGWPYGGPQVPVYQAAGKLRVQRVPVSGSARRIPLPDMSAGEKLLSAYLARVDGRTLAGESFRELSPSGDGAVYVPLPLEGPHEVVFFIESRTGQMVKRPAVGAEGFVLDHYDRAAVDNYLKQVGDRLMQAFRSAPPYAIFCDSLEVYESDWTPDFLEQFRKRRGYDLKPYLPALIADVGPKTGAIRHDWGMTLTELLEERFITPMRDWAHRNHTLFRLQGYGIPPATLSSNDFADLPEGEGAQWRILRASRWASSANHIYGRPVTSSETWTWLHSPSFRATPLDVKAEADLHFLQGINQLIGHGWPYSPESAGYPGWRFYAAAVFNDKNPWWIVMPDLSAYLQRMSYLLRQGKPANDVALYLPDDDAWASFATGGHVNMIETLRARVGPDVVDRVLAAGFNLDFFDDRALMKAGRVEKGGLALGTNKYKVVILPNVERIPMESLRRLEEFAADGGVLVATRRIPALAPGLIASAEEQGRIREISQRLFEGPSPAAHFVKDEAGDLARDLQEWMRPDVLISPAHPQIGFVHRSSVDAEIYFLANTGNVPVDAGATFRVQGMNPEWWNPYAGTVLPAHVEARPDGGTTIRLNIEPYGSRVLVFTKRSLPSSPGRQGPEGPSAVDLTSDWQVYFGKDTKPIHMEKLRSWTEYEATRYFSGVAAYEKEIIVPDSFLAEGIRVHLDFGEAQPVAGQRPESRMQAWIDAPVREAAVVYLNGRRVGSVWHPPYSLDLTGSLTRGPNRLRIVVGNLAINHMAGHSLPDYRLLNMRYGVRFEPQDMKNLQPLPSGLLGPLRLIPNRQEATPSGSKAP